MRLYTMFKRQWETEINQKIKKNAEHRFAGSKKVPTKKNDESKNSNGPERLQYQDSSDDSDSSLFIIGKLIK